MGFRRFVYGVLLISVFLFYVFQVSYFSWVLLWFSLAVPAFSLLLTLPVAFSCRLTLQYRDVRADGSTGQPVTVILHTALPVPSLRLRIVLENRFTGARIKRKLSLIPQSSGVWEKELPFRDCGVHHLSVRHPRITDFLGLFALPIRRPAEIVFLRLPVARSIAALQLRGPIGQQEYLWGMDPKRQMTERETKTVRTYREGDSLRDVHWKLTARHGELVIREYETLVPKGVPVLVVWTGEMDAKEQVMGYVLGLIRLFSEQELHGIFYWPNGAAGGLMAYDCPAQEKEAAANMLWEQLGQPQAAGEEPLTLAQFVAMAGVPAETVVVHEAGVCFADEAVEAVAEEVRDE